VCVCVCVSVCVCVLVCVYEWYVCVCVCVCVCLHFIRYLVSINKTILNISKTFSALEKPISFSKTFPDIHISVGTLWNPSRNLSHFFQHRRNHSGTLLQFEKSWTDPHARTLAKFADFTDRLTDRQAGRHICRQTDRQADRQTGRQSHFFPHHQNHSENLLQQEVLDRPSRAHISKVC
jgi:hypothetical protein